MSPNASGCTSSNTSSASIAVDTLEAAFAIVAFSDRSVASSASNSSYECVFSWCSPCNSAMRILAFEVFWSTAMLWSNPSLDSRLAEAPSRPEVLISYLRAFSRFPLARASSMALASSTWC
eukprot:scaffold101247_cov66-Phaeocystis_antarctica.AAC.3